MAEASQNNTEKQLPVVNKCEIPTKDGGKATLLYTDRAAWEAGGEENLKQAFLHSVDKPNTFILIGSEDTASDYLWIEHKNYEKNPHLFLKALFENSAEDLFKDFSEEEKIDYWKNLHENIQNERYQNVAIDTTKGIIFVAINPATVDRSFELQGDNQHLARLFLLGHEFDHPDQNRENTNTQIGKLRNEAQSDLTGVHVVKKVAPDSPDILDQILFQRSSHAILSTLVDENFDTRSFLQELFGTGKLDNLDHTTSALIDPNTGKTHPVDDKALKTALLSLREKIIENVNPEVQADGLKSFIEKSGNSDEFFNVTDNIMSEFKDFINAQGGAGASHHKSPAANAIHGLAIKQQYQPFIENYEHLDKEYTESINSLRSHYVMSGDDLQKSIDRSLIAMPEKHQQALDIMKEKGLDKEYPELAAALQKSVDTRESMIDEMRAALTTLEQEEPQLYKNFTTRGFTARVLMFKSIEDNLATPEMNSRLYNTLLEMKQNGSFKDDPVQTRIVDAFLNGIHSNPDQFDMSKINTPATEDIKTQTATNSPKIS